MYFRIKALNASQATVKMPQPGATPTPRAEIAVVMEAHVPGRQQTLRCALDRLERSGNIDWFELVQRRKSLLVI
jgi:hypothetical protein